MRMGAIAHDAGTSPLKNRRQNRVWSDADLRRMIEMRVVERKTELEIATEFDISWKSVRGIWWNRCTKMLSQADILSLQTQRQWTPAEVHHLAELYTRTTIRTKDLHGGQEHDYSLATKGRKGAIPGRAERQGVWREPRQHLIRKLNRR
jgi:hypothetical protein